MKTKKTNLTLPLLLSLLLSGCGIGTNGVSVGFGMGSGIGSHIGIGTSVNIPIGGQKGGNNSGINVIERKMVTYFGTDTNGNKESNSPIIGGYARELLEKRKDGQWLVQDFFEDQSGYARTDAFIIPQKRAYAFNAHPVHGSMRIYHRNGNIAEERNYINDKIVYAKIYNLNGKLIREDRP